VKCAQGSCALGILGSGVAELRTEGLRLGNLSLHSTLLEAGRTLSPVEAEEGRDGATMLSRVLEPMVNIDQFLKNGTEPAPFQIRRHDHTWLIANRLPRIASHGQNRTELSDLAVALRQCDGRPDTFWFAFPHASLLSERPELQAVVLVFP
jgi:hypothetical protein